MIADIFGGYWLEAGSMETLPPDFAQRIRVIRQSLNLPQTDFAELIGVSYASVSRWERGKAEPNALAWEKILGIEAAKIAFDIATRPAARWINS